MTDRLDAIEAQIPDASDEWIMSSMTIGQARWLVREVRRLRARRYNRDIELAEQLRGAESDLSALRQRFRDMKAKRNALFDEATALRSRYAEAERWSKTCGYVSATGDIATQDGLTIMRATEYKAFRLRHEALDVAHRATIVALDTLRARHAEAVKSAYLCGLHEAFTSPSADPETCWLHSKAKARLT